jgi:hypothetical protein
VHLARVEMNEEAAVRRHAANARRDARHQELEVLVEVVGIPARAHLLHAVRLVAEPATRGVGIRLDPEAFSHLRVARIEGRIDVDELRESVRKCHQRFEIFAENDFLHPLGAAGAWPRAA